MQLDSRNEDLANASSPVPVSRETATADVQPHLAGQNNRAPTGDRLEEDSLDADVREYLDDRRPGSVVPSEISSCRDAPRLTLVLREPARPADLIRERPPHQ